MKAVDLGQNWNGTRSVIYVGDNQIVTKDYQDVQPILDNNARLRAQNGNRQGRNGTWVADIPITLLWEWKKDWRRNHSDKWEWKTFLAQKINSRDYLKLRVTEGRI